MSDRDQPAQEPFNPQQIVFVGGLHRSGTTLLARALEGVYGATGLHDTGYPEDEGQFVQDVYDWRPAGSPGLFAFDPEAHLTEQSRYVTPDAARRLLECWEPYLVDPRANLLVEKSPPNLLRARFLRALFPDAKLVFTVRNPLITALATSKWSRLSISAGVAHTLHAYGLLFEDLRHLDAGWRLVRYESLMADPSACMINLAGLLGLEPERVPAPAIIDRADDAYRSVTDAPLPTRFWTRRVGKNRKRLNRLGIDATFIRHELAFVDRRFGESFAALGYDGVDLVAGAQPWWGPGEIPDMDQY
jgi:Sulfotransferase family